MAGNPVADEEILFRSVSITRGQCKRDEAGCWKLSSQAFADRSMRPSVDRSILCDANPAYTQKSPEDGVVSVVAVEVRAIKEVTQNDVNGNVIKTHVIDVISDALPGNSAHALIVPAPEYSSKQVFRKLLERLRHLAEYRGWTIEPKE